MSQEDSQRAMKAEKTGRGDAVYEVRGTGYKEAIAGNQEITLRIDPTKLRTPGDVIRRVFGSGSLTSTTNKGGPRIHLENSHKGLHNMGR